MSWELSAFTRAYAEYLEERISSFKELHFDIASPDSLEDIQDLGIDELLEALPKMQILLRKVLGCKPEMYAGVNFAMLTPLQLVVEESFQVYACTSHAILRIVDSYFQLNRTDCLLAIDIYKTAIAQSRALQQYYSDLSKTAMTTEVRFPNIEIPPIDFLDTMENHAQQMRQMRQQARSQESAGGAWAAYPTLERAPIAAARPERTRSAPRERSYDSLGSSRIQSGRISQAEAVDSLALPAARTKSSRATRASNAPALPEPPRGSRKALPPASSDQPDASQRKQLSRASSAASRELPRLPSSRSVERRAIGTRSKHEGSTMAQLESLEGGMAALALKNPTKDSRKVSATREANRRQAVEALPEKSQALVRSRSSNAAPVPSNSRSLEPATRGQAGAGGSRSERSRRGPSSAEENTQERGLIVAGRGRARAAAEEQEESNAIVARSRSRPTQVRQYAELPPNTGYGYDHQETRQPGNHSRYY